MIVRMGGGELKQESIRKINIKRRAYETAADTLIVDGRIPALTDDVETIAQYAIRKPGKLDGPAEITVNETIRASIIAGRNRHIRGGCRPFQIVIDIATDASCSIQKSINTA